MTDFSDYRPARHYTVEPDRAKEMILNLLRKRRRFALTQQAEYGHMYDVVNITIGGSLVERRETEEYAHSMVCENLDEACQFAVNCLNNHLSFAVYVTQNPGHHEQWVFSAERNKAIRERKASRVFA